MQARAVRVWLAYHAATWFAFQMSATVTMVFLITRLQLNPLELTFVGTVLELTVTLCEIPTGVVADTVSRKVSIVIGVALLGFGFLLYAVPSYPVILLAQVVWAVGYTFTSGADVAWITDEVGEEAARPLYVARRAGPPSGDLRRHRRRWSTRCDRLVAADRRRRTGAARQRRLAVVPHAGDRRSSRADPALRTVATSTMKRTVTDAVGTVRTPPDAPRDARRHGSHRARVGRIRSTLDPAHPRRHRRSRDRQRCTRRLDRRPPGARTVVRGRRSPRSSAVAPTSTAIMASSAPRESWSSA